MQIVAKNFQEGMSFADEFGFPILMEPSYTLNGQGKCTVFNTEELHTSLLVALNLSPTKEVRLTHIDS